MSFFILSNKRTSQVLNIKILLLTRLMIKLSDVPFFISEKCFYLLRTENLFFKSGKHKAVNVSTNGFFLSLLFRDEIKLRCLSNFDEIPRAEKKSNNISGKKHILYWKRKVHTHVAFDKSLLEVFLNHL